MSRGTTRAASATFCLVLLCGCRSGNGRSQDDRAAHAASLGHAATADASDAMMPRSAFKPEAIARAELREFLFVSPWCGNDPGPSMPKRIDPSLVENVLREAIIAARPSAGVAARSVSLARFYGTVGIVSTWISILNHRERDDAEVEASLELVAGVAALGDEVQGSFARAYYHSVLASRFAESHLPQILYCYADLLPKEGPEPTRARTEAIVTEKGKPSGDRSAAWRTDTVLQTLRELETAGSDLAKIEAIPDLDSRMDRVVDAYLEMDRSFRGSKPILTGVDWAEWRLLREAHREGAAVVVSALRRALPRIATRRDTTEERNRAARAIEFFGGELTTQERSYLRPPYRDRVELLTVE